MTTMRNISKKQYLYARKRVIALLAQLNDLTPQSDSKRIELLRLNDWLRSREAEISGGAGVRLQIGRHRHEVGSINSHRQKY